MKSYCKYSILAFSISIIFCIGCAGTPIKIGVIDQQFDSSKIDFTKPHMISASASGFLLFTVVPISLNDRQDTAYCKLLVKAGSDYITDVKIKESWTYAFFGTIYTTEIRATAYPRKY
jgi:hypothetical protein